MMPVNFYIQKIQMILSENVTYNWNKLGYS